MKKTRIAMTISLAFIGLFVFSAVGAAAAQGPPTEVTGDTHSGHQNAGEMQEYQFQSRTRLRINCTNSEINISMDVDADNVGDKEVTVEINCSEPVQMNMTMRQTEDGLLNGSTVRNRNRYRYQYGLAMEISVNCTNFTAKLKANVSDAKNYSWAYFNGTDWELVETHVSNGEAVANVDHFSTWTLLEVPDASPSIGIESTALLTLAFLAAGVAFIVYRAKRRA